MQIVKPYKSSLNKKQQVEKMFDTISSEYDKLNRLISFGLDVKWRKKLILMATSIQPKAILDVATGTGDLAIGLTTIGSQQIKGIDISAEMIKVGNQKIQNYNLQNQVSLSIADAENLPFDNHSFDIITIAFGVRNFENLKKGLSELLRVLSPKGQLLVLETSIPKNPIIRLGYKIHTNIFLPLIGKLFSRDKAAYSYLSKSAALFPCGEKFNSILSEVGFKNPKCLPQSMGVASIYSANK